MSKLNILFVTIHEVYSIHERNIYTDFIRQFWKQGHSVSIICPKERKRNIATHLKEDDGCRILSVRTLNQQKTNLIEKGVGMLLIQHQYIRALRRYFGDTRFDLVIYTTPPITFTRVVKFIKRRDGATTYLWLKDIFPQNAVDLGMMRRGGVLHRYFRAGEREMYRVSDHIGCMSAANVDYVLKHNPRIPAERVEVCPNCVDLSADVLAAGAGADAGLAAAAGAVPAAGKAGRADLNRRFNIPADATVLIYGGNLGKPQGIGFLLEVLASNAGRTDCFFIIVGTGTEYKRLSDWVVSRRPSNIVLLQGLPKAEYDALVKACDVGLIFLDRRFTIPNFPQRILPYMEYSMPVLIASDSVTDMGPIAADNGFGLYSLSGDVVAFNAQLDQLVGQPALITEMGRRGYDYLQKHYLAEHAAEIVLKHF